MESSHGEAAIDLKGEFKCVGVKDGGYLSKTERRKGGGKAEKKKGVSLEDTLMDAPSERPRFLDILPGG